MPRGIALTAGLLLLILAGIAMAVGLFWPRELEPARELVAFRRRSGARPANLGAIRLPDLSHHPGVSKANGLVGPPLDHSPFASTSAG